MNRQRRSCSTDLQTAFASLTNHQQVIVSVPEEEQQMHVHRLPNIYNQACNQRSFYENLKHKTFINKKRHSPKFLLKPAYQSPEDRFFSFFQRNRDLQGPSILSQQNESPQSILHFSLDYATIHQVKNIPNEDHSHHTQLIFPRDADVILFIFYVIILFMKDTFQYNISSEPQKLRQT